MQSVPSATKAVTVSSNPVLGEVYLIQRYVMKWFATRSWFSPGTPVSSTNKTEILLKVVLNTINHKPQPPLVLPIICFSIWSINDYSFKLLKPQNSFFGSN